MTTDDRPPRRRAKPGTGLRDKILAAAVAIFAEHGVHGSSVRAIAKRVGCNLAALNYHFGSKDELALCVLEQALGPMQARIALLDRYEAEACGTPLTVERIIEAIVRPSVTLDRDAEGGRPLIRLLQQARAIPTVETSRFFDTQFNPMILRFVEAFSRALPGHDRAELFWRYNFITGSLLHVLIDSDPGFRRLKRISDDRCDTDDEEALIAQLVAFGAAGFRAPAPAPKPMKAMA
ncbi:TetR/AcrR family transcriptional regulator [Humitalea sp. 24SJ18S-53]|uniref:TetR/AcrR family transcriptional regulator n=1 Tax=Humitalea sp. 24SJ18S-53 TaxID=3422307 RepID=UPI003D66B695